MNIKKALLFLCLLFVTVLETKGIESTVTECTIKTSDFDNKDNQVFDSLKIKARQVINTSEEVLYLDSMLTLAQKRDSGYLECRVMTFMARNYYNRMMPDSLMYWANKVDKLALKHKYYSLFFDTFSLVCSWELYDKNYDSALDKANRLYQMAKELDNADGMIASYETIGLIYLETFRYVEAIKAYKEGLRLQQQQKDSPRYGYQFQFLSYIIEAYLKLKDYKSADTVLSDAYTMVEKCKESENAFPYRRCIWLLDCYNIELYVSQKIPDKAKLYLEDARQYKDIDDFYVFCYFHLVSASYFQLIGDYRQALQHVDTVLAETGDDYLPALKIKAELLLEAGRGNEAARLYHKSINLIDSTYNESLSKQINQLRTIHEVDKLELKNQQLELESGSYKLKITMGLIIVLLIILMTIIFHYLYIRRMKNLLEQSDKELKKEREQLLLSEKNLSMAKEKAEASNRFKDIFLANMSHEVRTPLNAIVGFSSILTELFKQKDAEEYVRIIRRNSDLLLKLINDTISISLLQTDQSPFIQEDCEINECCRMVVDEMQSKLTSKVRLNFYPSTDSYILRTDAMRLRQILVNLLMNAIKFTEEGEINFSYRVDREKESVFFIVEDTGRGIPKEMQDKIFEPFEKVDVFSQGIGLGLTICKLVANRLGGSITLDSTYEKGTRMIFIHPIN